MRVYDVIYKKRNGGTLSKEEIDFLIKGYVEGSIPDYQISAFLMAVFFRSMDFDETLELTNAMIGSGVSYQFDDMEFPTVDKHSTGGVGDKISIPLVPIVTSFDVIVPMMSGRGLGHTGGTLDKLESIPGFRVDYDDAGFLSLLKRNRCAMIGQTGRIAPADKKLYALRDVTATVDSIPLITASIMSKKIAEGAMNFVFDVKYGSGAFMKSREEGEKLASYLTQTAKIAGRNADHVLSDMNVPLGRFIGNRLEIIESMEILKGNGPEDTTQLTEKLAAKMLVLCGLFHDEDSALS
ncbi:thymidine phosphorylase, partial [bacterium]|nr:thymidine phosphorylase [bacterium]